MLDEHTDELLHIDSYSFAPLYKNGIALGSLCFGLNESRKSPKQTHRPCSSESPRIAFRDMNNAWIIYDGKAYCVQSISHKLFKKLIPSTRNEAVNALLIYDRLDIVQRWYILCEMKKVKIYRSKIEAEKSLDSKETGDDIISAADTGGVLQKVTPEAE